MTYINFLSVAVFINYILVFYNVKNSHATRLRCRFSKLVIDSFEKYANNYIKMLKKKNDKEIK